MIPLAWRTLTRAAEVLPGPWLPEPDATESADGVLHGASAGEVRAALACLPALTRASPGSRWLVTSGTRAGIAAGAAARLPRDLPGPTGGFLARVSPRSLVLVEAELWPNLLAGAASRGIPIGVLGARMSPRTLRRLRLAPGAARSWLAPVAAWAAASEPDAERLASAGVPGSRIHVTGWLKWQPAGGEDRVPALAAELPARFSGDLGCLPLLVLGSVHPGEIRALARAARGGPLEPGRCRWLAVARHETAARHLAREGLRACPAGTFSLDARFGVLGAWYRLAGAAFVGGGRKGSGVHDLLEPLSVGLRPLFFADRGDPGGVGEALLAAGLGVRLDRVRGPPPLPDRAPGAWERLRSERDGRVAGAAFLAARGVLP